MPKIWTDTIETHRRTVHDRVLDAAANLVDEHGLTSVTMSAVAEKAGIGRATLYRYFADVDAILTAWHERQVGVHLAHLGDVAADTANATDRLGAVLLAYAFNAYRHEHTDVAASLHRADHMAEAEQRLHAFIRDLIAESVHAGELRDDITPTELAGYCLHALTAARSLTSKEAVQRLVAVTVDGLRRRLSP